MAERDAAPQPTMTAAEALAAAAAEGLTLVRSEYATGFKGVYRNGTVGKPFEAQLHRGGRNKYLGMFATAEEAALAYARALGPEGVAAALVPQPRGRPRTGHRWDGVAGEWVPQTPPVPPAPEPAQPALVAAAVAEEIGEVRKLDRKRKRAATSAGSC